ncbi:uncharacterized protein LOC115463166 isoform X2 [Microcaecilia unicolor]|uniref:Uncharacterized protein LOC115463166 isoform X2 n=1 Tax=Microcaecilia unicolor TaxID=1415580 RepID=A0A6P7X7J8_9AMPH|nr:uncharacterized protein LOC115463166 isoform X2 [Microcaecilia unicolor]
MTSREYPQVAQLPKVTRQLSKYLSSSSCHNNPLHKGGKLSNELQAHYMNRKSTGNDQVLEKLQDENAKLKYELEDLRSQYEQLLEEGKNEYFEEKRVNLLKAQVMQLERQVVLLTEGLSSRASLMLDLENSLKSVSEKFRSLLGLSEHSAEVPITRTDLVQIIETCQALRIRLQRNYQATGLEKIALHWLIPRRNLTKQPVSLIDLCYGKTENLNLHYVAALEEKLSKLFRHLHSMRQTLSFILAPDQRSVEQAHAILPTAVYARLINHVTTCNQSLEECCRDLLTLTLIMPSAPWAKLEHTVSQEFTVENMLATLPAFPKGAPQQRARRAAEAFVKAINYSRLMAMQQVHALQAELNFHRDLYNLQVTYTESLFKGIKQAYHAFQENVGTVLCSPLEDVLSSYTELKTEASEAALRDFLTVFKSNFEQIQDAVETLTPSKNPQHEGDEALSKFGKDFFLSLERSLKECGEQRDKAAGEVETLRTELNQALEDLQDLRKRKERSFMSRRHSTKSERESTEGEAAGALDQNKDISKEKSGSVITSQAVFHQLSNPIFTSQDVEAPLSLSSQKQQQSSERIAGHRSKSLQRRHCRKLWVQLLMKHQRNKSLLSGVPTSSSATTAKCLFIFIIKYKILQIKICL